MPKHPTPNVSNKQAPAPPHNSPSPLIRAEIGSITDTIRIWLNGEAVDNIVDFHVDYTAVDNTPYRRIQLTRLVKDDSAYGCHEETMIQRTPDDATN